MQLKNINMETIVGAHQDIPKEMTLLEFLNNAKNTNGVLSTSMGHHDTVNSAYKPVPPPKPLSPPYRMPPQPLGSPANIYGEATIPGAAPSDQSIGGTVSNISLRTHSSKFPIERELILSSDKGGTKIPLMHENRTPSGPRRSNGMQLLTRPTGSIAPDHPPKHMHAWNSQQIPQTQQSEIGQQQQTLLSTSATTTTGSGAIPRTPARLPEDVTALAERDNNNKDRDATKNAVTKTYHTLKDLISGKFKKDTNGESTDELNNVVVQQQQQQQHPIQTQQDDLRSPYSALPVHMRQSLNQSQPNIWNGGKTNGELNMSSSTQRSYGTSADQSRVVQHQQQQQHQQQRANSQPQLNMPSFERRGSQTLLDQVDRRGSLANIDVTDSDEGGFASRSVRRPQTMYQIPHHSVTSTPPTNQHPHQIHSSRNSPHAFQNVSFNNQQYIPSPYQHSHVTPTQYSTPLSHQQQQMMQAGQTNSQMSYGGTPMSQHNELTNHNGIQQDAQMRQDILRASFQKQQLDIQHQQLQQSNNQSSGYSQEFQSPQQMSMMTKNQQRPVNGQQDHSKQIPESAGSSDYDKSGNLSSNVDSGRGSAIYSSGRKAQLDTESSDSPVRNGTKNDDAEWVDIVDAELRHILEPGMQGLTIRPESTVSGSVSSMSPPLPPLSPDNSSYKPIKAKETSKQEYGTDSYNRPGRNSNAIGPSRAGWPGASVQKQGPHSQPPRPPVKKHDQAVLKRHLFGLDNDLTSTTTRSLDLESLLGGPWGTGQSVSDSETDTQGIRHIRSQLEGLEHMYSEVLKMLGSRGGNGPSRMHDTPLRGAARRRHGSLSSLPSSSVSGRPIRDRRRSDDRRKVRDMKGINKRFQRLESHVVTLARSVAHLSSEMRSQHLVTQELERLRDELTALRSQTTRSQHIYRNSNEPEPPNLTNPRRVKKLTKFFGDDPPLMRLFLKSLGYEKYASLFETERVGMIELPYLGEERLQKLGVPLGPRLRILQEAQISLCKDTTLCIV